MLDLLVCIYSPNVKFGNELSVLLRGYNLESVNVSDYPSNILEERNVLFLDASFEEGIEDVSFTLPVLKIFKSCPDFESISFHDFILYPFQSKELYCRIINLYNLYKNFRNLESVTNSFKSYLLNLYHDVYSPAKLIKNKIGYLRTRNEQNSEESVFESTLLNLDSMLDILMKMPYATLASDSLLIEEEIDKVDVTLLIKNIVTQLNFYANTQGVEIIYFSAFEEKPIIIANYTYLWRMIYNLINNAIKFCLGGGVVSICLTRNENNLRLEILDDGIGMTNEQLVVLRLYMMAKEETKTLIGRGMVIVKLVANTMKAIVNVDSEIGKGTTFTIEFTNVDWNALA